MPRVLGVQVAYNARQAAQVDTLLRGVLAAEGLTADMVTAALRRSSCDRRLSGGATARAIVWYMVVMITASMSAHVVGNNAYYGALNVWDRYGPAVMSSLGMVFGRIIAGDSGLWGVLAAAVTSVGNVTQAIAGSAVTALAITYGQRRRSPHPVSQCTSLLLDAWARMSPRTQDMIADMVDCSREGLPPPAVLEDMWRAIVAASNATARGLPARSTPLLAAPPRPMMLLEDARPSVGSGSGRVTSTSTTFATAPAPPPAIGSGSGSGSGSGGSAAKGARRPATKRAAKPRAPRVPVTAAKRGGGGGGGGSRGGGGGRGRGRGRALKGGQSVSDAVAELQQLFAADMPPLTGGADGDGPPASWCVWFARLVFTTSLAFAVVFYISQPTEEDVADFDARQAAFVTRVVEGTIRNAFRMMGGIADWGLGFISREAPKLWEYVNARTFGRYFLEPIGLPHNATAIREALLANTTAAGNATPAADGAMFNATAAGVADAADDGWVASWGSTILSLGQKVADGYKNTFLLQQQQYEAAHEVHEANPAAPMETFTSGVAVGVASTATRDDFTRLAFVGGLALLPLVNLVSKAILSTARKSTSAVAALVDALARGSCTGGAAALGALRPRQSDVQQAVREVAAAVNPVAREAVREAARAASPPRARAASPPRARAVSPPRQVAFAVPPPLTARVVPPPALPSPTRPSAVFAHIQHRGNLRRVK